MQPSNIYAWGWLMLAIFFGLAAALSLPTGPPFDLPDDADLPPREEEEPHAE